MPWTYTINSELNVVFTKATGALTDDDLAVGARTAYQDPRFHSDLNGFFDYSGVTSWKVTTDFLASLAAKRRFSVTTKTAIFVQGSLSYGMTRIYQGSEATIMRSY
jgi:hypothetical protein